MILLATVWLLLVKPVPLPDRPDMKEFVVETVDFASVEDCDVAGRKWMDELTDAAYAPRHRLEFGEQRPRYAPPGATVTYTCVSRE